MPQTKRKLLIVEDDVGLQSQLRWCFDDYEVLCAEDCDSALAELRRHEPGVVTLDLGLPPDPTNASVGLQTLSEILNLAPQTKVIVVTGNDDRDNALQAINLGAYDFYQKPVDADILKLIVDRANNLHQLEQENQQLSQQQPESALAGIIAASPQMLKVCKIVEKVAPTDVTTLLLGESGTGKEVVARALHNLSLRKNKNFVAINCAAIPENLLESELFGYEKGAFTGAAKQTRGKIEYADGGTFFLDEVGDLPMALQAKLLRFLQERTIERVGGRKEIPVDVRVICATHRALSTLISEGSFREDLYYRISEVTVQIPPLRERQGDAITLGRYVLDKFRHEMGINAALSFSKDAIQALENYSWPGNVRELENKIKRAMVMRESNQISAEDLELDAEQQHANPLNLRQVRESAERQAINRALIYTNNNLSQAAELLGITRPTLYALLNKFNMKT